MNTLSNFLKILNERINQLIKQIINYKGVYRTALATQGLLNEILTKVLILTDNGGNKMWPCSLSCDLFLMIGPLFLYLFYAVLHLFYIYGTVHAWGHKSEKINWGHIVCFSAVQAAIAQTGT